MLKNRLFSTLALGALVGFAACGGAEEDVENADVIMQDTLITTDTAVATTQIQIDTAVSTDTTQVGTDTVPAM